MAVEIYAQTYVPGLNMEDQYYEKVIMNGTRKAHHLCKLRYKAFGVKYCRVKRRIRGGPDTIQVAPSERFAVVAIDHPICIK
jgi:hypothetical protein